MRKTFCKKIQEKCERCGEKAFDTVACFPCNEFHSLCAACLDLHHFTYANESGECFLKDPIEKIREKKAS